MASSVVHVGIDTRIHLVLQARTVRAGSGRRDVRLGVTGAKSTVMTDMSICPWINAWVDLVGDVRTVGTGGTSHFLVARTVVYCIKQSATWYEGLIASILGSTRTTVAVYSRVNLVGQVGVVWPMVGGTGRLMGMACQGLFGFAHQNHFQRKRNLSRYLMF